MPVRRIVSARRPETAKREQYHIACKIGDVARYILLPGDPDRVLKMVKHWDKARQVTCNRQYLIYTGRYKGIPISACSTGIGCPATAIAVEELANIGAETFIRVGSTGAIQEDIECGDLVISTGAVRLEGTSKQYVTMRYPAVASYDVLLALIQAAETLGYSYHVGITASTDSFYCGQGRPGFKGYWQSWMDKIIPDLKVANVLNFEMEVSTLFTLGNIFSLRAGCICAVFANRITDKFRITGEREAGLAATEALKILSEWDTERDKQGKKYWFPSLIHQKLVK